MMFRVRYVPRPGAADAAELEPFPLSRLPAVLCLLLMLGLARPARAWASAWPPRKHLTAGEVTVAILVEEASRACAWRGREGEPPLPVLVPLSLEGQADASSLRPALECAAGQSLEIIPRVHPPDGWQDQEDPYAAISPWLDRLSAFLGEHAGSLGRIELSPGDAAGLSPSSWAFLVEKTGSLARSFRPAFSLIAGPYEEAEAGWIEGLPHRRIRPYIDALSLRGGTVRGAAGTLLQDAYPGIPIWSYLEGGREAGDLLAAWHEGRASGAATLVLPEPMTPAVRATASAFIDLVPGRYVPDPEPHRLWIEEPSGSIPAGSWSDTLGPERVAVFRIPVQHLAVRLRAGGAPLRQLRAFDLADGRELAGRIERGPGEGEAALVLLEAPRGPLLVRYVQAGDPRADAETVGVTAEVELTAAEIVARLRAVEEAQRRATEHYTATATLSYHYRADTVGISVDVTSVNRFFWKEGVGEYEEIGLFVNGARWRGPAPDLPFVQADKVKEVPIEVRLDEAYEYRLAGRDRVRGRPAYVLEFDPVATDDDRYSGRVWIDAETFERLRIRLVQEGLEPPITSSEDVIEFGPAPGSESVHWVPLEGYRQMTFTVLGRAVVVERTVAYEDFAVNREDFDEARRIAWSSGRRMARDDADGFAYMLRQPGGGLQRRGDSLKNVALIGGLTFGTSNVVSSPIVGINYFDFDWRGTGTQVDLAWAGPFILASWTDPALAGSRWELSAEGHLLGAREKLKRSTDQGRRRAEDLDVLGEAAYLTLARPLSTNTKGEVQIQASHEWFGRTDDTDGAMLVPPDLLTTTALARWRYQRAGFGVEAWGSASKRNGWEDWGFFPADPNVPPGAQGSGSDDRYQRWGGSISKSFYPGGFQKLAMRMSYDAGSGLDRFSRFRVGDFGSVGVRGYNGRDYTFDRGLSGRLEWLSPVPGTGLSLEVNLDGAVIENREDFTVREEDQGVRNPAYREYLIGGGLGVSFNGPWGSLIIASASRAIHTSMDATASSPTVSIKLIKTFGDWPWRRQPVGAEQRDRRAEAGEDHPRPAGESPGEER